MTEGAKVRVLPMGVSGEDLAKEKDRKAGATKPKRTLGRAAPLRGPATSTGKPARAVKARASERRVTCTVCGKAGHNARSHHDKPRAAENEGGGRTRASSPASPPAGKAPRVKVTLGDTPDSPVRIPLTIEIALDVRVVRS